MVQTRHKGGATSSGQSDPPQRLQQHHRYATRSASQAESHEEAAEDDRDPEVVSRRAPPLVVASRARASKGRAAAPAAAAALVSGRRRKSAAALEPVEEIEEEEQDDESAGASDADADDGNTSDDDDAQEEEEHDSEEEAMLQGLAASIAAAFKPAAAKQQQQQQPQKQQQQQQHQQPAPSDSEAASDDDEEADADDNASNPSKKLPGQWCPSTGLAPAPPAARVALQQLGRPEGVSAAAGRAAPLDPKTAAKAAREQATKRDTAGKRWYDLPATPITDDVKRELRLLRLRGAYDPKRFYKSYDAGRFPRYFAVATVQDDPLESASARLSRKERRRATITEQLLADDHLAGARKRRFDKLQDEAERLAGMGKSGARGLAANKRQRASSLPRSKKSHHRPKH
jgi:hypothetical protein